MKKSLRLLASFFAPIVVLLFARPAHALPEYAAFAGTNCMACHVGPVGGFGRKPLAMNDPGYISDKMSASGDFLFMALYNERPQGENRFVLFPMEASVDLAFTPTPNITMAASNDFGTFREAYAMVHNEAQTVYARAGFFTLPYGILFEDHTSFIKEGRVETGDRNFEEIGTGAGLFGVRYKDSGIEAGYNGQPFFLNIAMTAGVVGQESRSFPSSQSGSKRALTRRAGFIWKNFCLGGSMYSNDNELLDRRILRYGGFGWVKMGPVALLFEHDEGEDEQFNVSGSSQSDASYVELVYGFPVFQKNLPSYLKLRWEQLDPNRSLSGDEYQRWLVSYQFSPIEYLSVETYYRHNIEPGIKSHNDDVFVLTHVHF